MKTRKGQVLINILGIGEVILTAQQIETVKLVAVMRPKEAAQELCIAKKTVDFHLAGVYQKLSVSRAIDAVNVLKAHGVIP